jgi:hypothetical protein
MTGWRTEAMSDFTQLAVVSFFGAVGFLGGWYIAPITNDMGDAVLTGFIGGHPIATTDRWLIFYNRYVPTVAAAAVWGLFLAFAVVLMANHVENADTKLLAYFLAFIATLGSLMWLAIGATMVVRCRSLLRQAEAD